MKDNIKHVWFDLDGTLTVHTPEFHKDHNDLRYKAYSEVVGKPINDDLIKEFNEAYAKAGSNSAVFTALGKPSDYWMKHFSTLDQTKYYDPVPDIYETLDSLRELVPISLFTNVTLGILHKTLSVVNIDYSWFTHILSGDDVVNRKPALDGFHLMIEKSGIPAQQILYVGDRVDVDIKPANEVGMLSCLVYSKSDEATYSFEKLSDLLSLFE